LPKKIAKPLTSTPPTRRRQDVDEVRDHQRRLGQQQPLDLAGQRPLRLEIDCRDVLPDQPVVGLVLEARSVPR
jgi:hypothetical protein